jgi:metal-responsive CopG/Arc/MetJ family transcriptional regulator
LDSSYGMVAPMARRQVIVQLDDRLLVRLDREAKTSHISRSEVLRRAADLYLRASDEAAKERRMVEAYRRIPDDADPQLDQALMRLAADLPPW